jgi:L-alanine-DL-glutamate epimerase-like enolase superfamily enzyme
MVDAWISLDVETAIRLGEAVRPYRIKWLEDNLLSDDLEVYARVRERLPGTTLASGSTGTDSTRSRLRLGAGWSTSSSPTWPGAVGSAPACGSAT